MRWLGLSPLNRVALLDSGEMIPFINGAVKSINAQGRVMAVFRFK